jgi:4-diphosphocytidyl-2-C-methyl-D-erythritol kinase
MRVTEFAPAKVNIALHVLGRRADGYHELDSVVGFAGVGDFLDIESAATTTLSVDGPFAADLPVTADNLVLKAHAALGSVAHVGHVSMRLTKNLPVASGIGGGSADAAAALRGLIKLFGLKLEPAALQKLALSLGADVPVCLYGRACRMQGVGEVITELEHLPAKAIVLVNPLKSCATADVFRNMLLKPGDSFGTALDVKAPATWRNDMTDAAIAACSDIALVLNSLNTLAPDATIRMSGSGATCFALFKSLDEAEDAAIALTEKHREWWVSAALLT